MARDSSEGQFGNPDKAGLPLHSALGEEALVVVRADHRDFVAVFCQASVIFRAFEVDDGVVAFVVLGRGRVVLVRSLTPPQFQGQFLQGPHRERVVVAVGAAGGRNRLGGRRDDLNGLCRFLGGSLGRLALLHCLDVGVRLVHDAAALDVGAPAEAAVDGVHILGQADPLFVVPPLMSR